MHNVGVCLCVTKNVNLQNVTENLKFEQIQLDEKKSYDHEMKFENS